MLSEGGRKERKLRGGGRKGREICKEEVRKGERAQRTR